MTAESHSRLVHLVRGVLLASADHVRRHSPSMANSFLDGLLIEL